MIAKVVVKAFVAPMDDWRTHFRQDKGPRETDKVRGDRRSNFLHLSHSDPPR